MNITTVIMLVNLNVFITSMLNAATFHCHFSGFALEDLIEVCCDMKMVLLLELSFYVQDLVAFKCAFPMFVFLKKLVFL